MSYTQIKPQKGSDIVLAHLKQQIMSGEYSPGSRLPTVVELSKGFNVGRSTIREALSGLKAMGWIEIRHGGGTFVSQQLPSEETFSADLFTKTESLQEVLDVRTFIESGCASLAAKNHTAADLVELQRILEHMASVLDDERSGEQADVVFHLQIAQATHNSLFIQMMESLSSRLQESMGVSRRLWFFAERASVDRLLQEHRGIYQAIRDRNEALASKRMMEHIAKVDSILRKLPLT
jgi:GntR family transcriptional repressor for pyruvate dehydrogenase complex